MYEPTSAGVGVCPEQRPRVHAGADRLRARSLTLRVDAFTRESLEHESRQLGVSVEELTRFAVLYYLADRDSGRVARRPPIAPERPDAGDDPHSN